MKLSKSTSKAPVTEQVKGAVQRPAELKRIVDPRFQYATDLINHAVSIAGDEEDALDLLVLAAYELSEMGSHLYDILAGQAVVQDSFGHCSILDQPTK
jgi:hypothetical protein